MSVLVTLREKINALKRQMMIHSYLYYVLYEPIISDDEWQSRANLLARINQPTGLWDEEFKNWSGDTGCHLTFDEWTVHKAKYLLELQSKDEGSRCRADYLLTIRSRRRAPG